VSRANKTHGRDAREDGRDDDRQRSGSLSSDQRQSTRLPATDQEIQKWISRHHGFVPESAWIAHCKELFGINAPRISNDKNPPEKLAAIKQAFRHFGLV
jgi:hypothetical protein